MADDSKLIAERRRELDTMREHASAYPNDFRRNALAEELHKTYDAQDDETLREAQIEVAVAGRMMVKRVMGKASFIKLQDRSGQIQVRLERDRLVEGRYQAFKKWDVGDIVAATGTLFRTKTGELTVRADELLLLTKSLRPLPEKFHGLADQETRYRQRYVDLIMNEGSRNVFRTRSAIVAYIRAFLDAQDYLEVETPMMQTTPGGAIARPFTTHHNALDMTLYLRIAPELNLKRLIVGGYERVYEINRNFRNEGVSTQHNPEFTMLELYRAYADYEDLIDMVEALLLGMSQSVLGDATVRYQGEEFDFSQRFARMTIAEVIASSICASQPLLRSIRSRSHHCRDAMTRIRFWQTDSNSLSPDAKLPTVFRSLMIPRTRPSDSVRRLQVAMPAMTRQWPTIMIMCAR